MGNSAATPNLGFGRCCQSSTQTRSAAAFASTSQLAPNWEAGGIHMVSCAKMPTRLREKSFPTTRRPRVCAGFRLLALKQLVLLFVFAGSPTTWSTILQDGAGRASKILPAFPSTFSMPDLRLISNRELSHSDFPMQRIGGGPCS